MSGKDVAVVDIPVEVFGPKMVARLGIEELHVYPNARARFAKTSFQNESFLIKIIASLKSMIDGSGTTILKSPPEYALKHSIK